MIDVKTVKKFIGEIQDFLNENNNIIKVDEYIIPDELVDRINISNKSLFLLESMSYEYSSIFRDREVFEYLKDEVIKSRDSMNEMLSYYKAEITRLDL